MRPFVLLLIAIPLAILAYLMWEHGREGPLVVSGFVESDEIRVGSRVGGRVAHVNVEEGARVKPGDVLYELDPFDLQERLAEARAALAANQAELDRLKTGYRVEEIEQARAKHDQLQATLTKLEAGPRKQEIEAARQQVKIAEAGMEFAQKEYDRLTRLRDQAQAASQREFDEASRAFKSAQGQLSAAQQQLSELEEGTRKEEIAEARAMLAAAAQQLKLMESGYRKEEVARAQANVDAGKAQGAAIEQQLAELTVKSPCDCLVESIDLRPGDLVGQNAPSVSLLDPTKLWVRAYVPQGRLGAVQVGKEVPVVVDSDPGERLKGRISFIAREAEFTPRNVQTPEERSKQVFRIKVMLESGLDKAKVGVAADVLLGEAK